MCKSWSVSRGGRRFFALFCVSCLGVWNSIKSTEELSKLFPPLHPVARISEAENSIRLLCQFLNFLSAFLHESSQLGWSPTHQTARASPSLNYGANRTRVEITTIIFSPQCARLRVLWVILVLLKFPSRSSRHKLQPLRLGCGVCRKVTIVENSNFFTLESDKFPESLSWHSPKGRRRAAEEEAKNPAEKPASEASRSL